MDKSKKTQIIKEFTQEVESIAKYFASNPDLFQVAKDQIDFNDGTERKLRILIGKERIALNPVDLAKLKGIKDTDEKVKHG